MMPLPLIRNEKPVDPADPSTTSPNWRRRWGRRLLSPGTQAIRVGRSRFAPVKKNRRSAGDHVGRL